MAKLPPANMIMAPRQKNRMAMKELIVDASEKVFASKPFTKVSMRDIAREAGISPALIYRHFPDQQHLFVEAFLRGTRQLLEQFADHIAKSRKPGLEKAADIFISYLTENEQYFKMMTHFMLEGTIHEGLLDRLNTIERSMLDQFDTIFRKAGAKGNVRLVSHCFFAALNGILITFRRHPGRSDEEVDRHMHRIGHIMAHMFLQAVRSEVEDIFA